MKCYLLLATTLFAVGPRESAQQQNSAIKSAIHKAHEVVTFSCAIIISPTFKQIDKMKKQYGANYDAIIDDNVYYQSESDMFLDSVKLKKLYKYATGTMTFKSRDGKLYTINLEQYKFAIILFNGKNNPIQAELTDFQKSYKKYMN